MLLLSASLVVLLGGAPSDLCKGKKAGSITFFNQEVARDQPLPKEVSSLDFGGKMFALMCAFADVGPQENGVRMGSWHGLRFSRHTMAVPRKWNSTAPVWRFSTSC